MPYPSHTRRVQVQGFRFTIGILSESFSPDRLCAYRGRFVSSEECVQQRYTETKQEFLIRARDVLADDISDRQLSSR